MDREVDHKKFRVNTERRVQEISDEIEDKIKELKLTEQQYNFCTCYVFLAGLDPAEAAELAGYSNGKAENSKMDEDQKKDMDRLFFRKKGAELLRNPKIVKAIQLLTDGENEKLLVNDVFVINELKTIVKKGTEMGKLKALELIGKKLRMWVDVQKQETPAGDPSEIAKGFFADRIKEKGNVVSFNKEEETGTD